MKIIENKSKILNSKYPAQVTCENCGSIIEVEEDDLKEGYLRLPTFICPCCGKSSYANDIHDDDKELRPDTLVFPDHFYHFDIGNIKTEEIKEYTEEAVQYFREHPEDSGGTFVINGQSLVVIKDWPEDEQYEILVSNDYYTTYIEYADKDYQKEENYGGQDIKYKRRLESCEE